MFIKQDDTQATKEKWIWWNDMINASALFLPWLQSPWDERRASIRHAVSSQFLAFFSANAPPSVRRRTLHSRNHAIWSHRQNALFFISFKIKRVEKERDIYLEFNTIDINPTPIIRGEGDGDQRHWDHGGDGSQRKRISRTRHFDSMAKLDSSSKQDKLSSRVAGRPSLLSQPRWRWCTLIDQAPFFFSTFSLLLLVSSNKKREKWQLSV